MNQPRSITLMASSTCLVLIHPFSESTVNALAMPHIAPQYRRSPGNILIPICSQPQTIQLKHHCSVPSKLQKMGTPNRLQHHIPPLIYKPLVPARPPIYQQFSNCLCDPGNNPTMLHPLNHLRGRQTNTTISFP